MRLRAALAATVTLAAPTVAEAPARVAKRRCARLFTVQMGERAGRVIYRDGHTASVRNLRLLGRLEMCTYTARAQAVVRWYDRHQRSLWNARRAQTSFTGYVVAGPVSTFGPPLDPKGTTADGGSDARPCIAIRDDSTLGRTFLVTIGSHHADLIHCDWGPAAWTGRAIDVTGSGAEAMGLDPYDFPTDSYGTARELR